MAKINYIAIVFIGTLLVLSCASTTNTLQEPIDGKNLIIGSIIFENKGYQNRNEVYFDNLDVAIIGLYEENGKEKVFGKWVTTEKNGYFLVPNVPDGKYAIKAIRVNLAGQAYLTFANDFRTMVDNYRLWPTENVAFSGTFFDTQPVERIVNLKHNYFTCFVNREIQHNAYDIVSDFQASNGEVISRPPIFKYFFDKFPDSGWNEYLKKLLDAYNK